MDASFAAEASADRRLGALIPLKRDAITNAER
jgi:hypothetical protein